MKRLQNTHKIAVLLTALLCPVSLFAVGISDIDDLFIGVWSPFGSNWEKSVPVCVTGEASETAYRIRASSLNNPAQFKLNNNIGDNVRYRVFWYTGDALERRERLRPDRESRRAYRFSTGSSCSSSNATLSVRISNRDIRRAVPAIYDDTLLITLSPI